MTATLFSPLTIRSTTLPNRVVVSPMCMYSAEEGFAGDWHLVHLGSRAVGGAGLVIAEATAISAGGRITPGDLGIWSDEHVPALRRITDFIAAQGSVAGVQLAHAGRKAGRTLPWRGNSPISVEEWGPLIAPSAIAFEPGWQIPVAMDEAGMAELVDDFVSATRRAAEAGFKVVEAHFAHGYLLHEFLSPLANTRTDDYGGTLENRARLPLRVIRAMRDAWPEELPLFVRLSIVDWAAGGISLDETIQVVRWMKDLGVDLVDCSSGAVVPGENIPAAPGYHAAMTREIRSQSGMATGVVGMIVDPALAEELVNDGTADLVFIARAMLQHAYWTRDAADLLGGENAVSVPVQYSRAIARMKTRAQW